MCKQAMTEYSENKHLINGLGLVGPRIWFKGLRIVLIKKIRYVDSAPRKISPNQAEQSLTGNKKMTNTIIIELLDQMPEYPSEAEWKELFIQVESIANDETPEAQMTIAKMYKEGLGVLEDIEKSISWYTKAAEAGLVEAQYLLGELYYRYFYIDENSKQKAAKWTEKAAENGHVKAQHKLSFLYTYGHGVNKDPKQAIKWCGKAAEQGNESAQLELGHQYSYGLSLSKDLLKAAEWYKKAAKQGNTEAQRSLGELYEGGWGVEQNYPLAYSLFSAAAINGCDEGTLFRNRLEQKMSADQIAEAKVAGVNIPFID